MQSAASALEAPKVESIPDWLYITSQQASISFQNHGSPYN